MFALGGSRIEGSFGRRYERCVLVDGEVREEGSVGECRKARDDVDSRRARLDDDRVRAIGHVAPRACDSRRRVVRGNERYSALGYRDRVYRGAVCHVEGAFELHRSGDRHVGAAWAERVAQSAHRSFEHP